MRKINFKKLFLASCATSAICSASQEAFAGGGGASYYDIYNLQVPNARPDLILSHAASYLSGLTPPYAIKFDPQSLSSTPNPYSLIADLTTTIQAVDINNVEGAQIIVRVGTQTLQQNSSYGQNVVTHLQALVDDDNTVNSTSYTLSNLESVATDVVAAYSGNFPGDMSTLSQYIDYFNNSLASTPSLQTAFSVAYGEFQDAYSKLGVSTTAHDLSVALNDVYNFVHTQTVPAATTFTLGSIINSAGSQKLGLVVEDGQNLILNGDNNWTITIPTTTDTKAGTFTFSAGSSNANLAYSYTGNGGTNYVQADAQGNGGGNWLANQVTGPYNDYRALASVDFSGATNIGSRFVVKSIAGNSAPITLNSNFVFPQMVGNNNVTLDVATSATLTGASLGSIYTPPMNPNISGNYTGGFGAITGSAAATLTVNVAGATIDNPLYLSNVWSATGDGVYANGSWTPGSSYLGYLVLQTPTVITDASAVSIGNPSSGGNMGNGSRNGGIVIGNTQVTIRPNSNQGGTALAYGITPQVAGAALVVDSSQAGGALMVQLASFSGNSSGFGNVKLAAKGNALTIMAFQGLGSSQGALNSFEIDGDSHAIASSFIYTNNLILNTSGVVEIPNLRLSDGGVVTLNQSLAAGSQITFTETTTTFGQNNSIVTAPYVIGTTFNLGSATFNAGITSSAYSAIKLTGPLTIGTSLDANETDYGHFNIDGSLTQNYMNGPTTFISTLDLSEVSSLTINFTPAPTALPTNSQLPTNNNGEYKLALFTTSDVSSSGNPGQVNGIPATATLNVTPSSFMVQNGTVTWAYEDGYITSSTDLTQVTNGLDPEAPATIMLKSFVDNSIATNTATSGTSTISAPVSQFATAILSAPNAIAAQVVADRTPVQATATAAMIESTGLAAAHITGHTLNAGIIDNVIDVMPVAEAEEGGVAAGDGSKYGAWVSGFGQKARQKSYSNTVGYKVQTTGGTLGFDAKVSENITLGVAWTNTHGIVKHSDAQAGNKANIVNNIFSLYALASLEKGWLVTGSLSGGIANTKINLMQLFGTTPIYGSAKHKTKAYMANIQAVRPVSLNDTVLLEPTLGLYYTQFNDDGYTQRGDIPRQTISARKSYNLEGLVGGKVVGLYNHNGYIFKPNLSAYAHITIVDKQGKIHTSLDATTGKVAMDQPKASKAWYSGGAGLFVTKGAYEAGVSYELQLDKKYVGHQGTLKVRVEF